LILENYSGIDFYFQRYWGDLREWGGYRESGRRFCIIDAREYKEGGGGDASQLFEQALSRFYLCANWTSFSGTIMVKMGEYKNFHKYG
jgi:hypothetical protein